MNLKSALKYLVSDGKKSLMIYYLIIYLLFFVTIMLTKGMNLDGKISSMDMASMVFLFVIGLNLFKAPFRFFLQNATSRKTMFLSFLCFSGGICFLMTVVDQINYHIFGRFSTYVHMFSELYSQRYGAPFGIQQTLESMLWSLFAYLFFILLGFFITVLYYRCNKWQKLAVTIGVPGMLFLVLPLFDMNFFQGKITTNIIQFILFALGLEHGGNPLIGTVSFALGGVLFGGLAFLLMRRATVKE